MGRTAVSPDVSITRLITFGSQILVSSTASMLCVLAASLQRQTQAQGCTQALQHPPSMQSQFENGPRVTMASQDKAASVQLVAAPVCLAGFPKYLGAVIVPSADVEMWGCSARHGLCRGKY